MENNFSNLNNLKAVILAAGKGTRFNSEEAQIPKHMRKADGKPLLYYVLKSIDFIENKKDIILIVNYLKETIMEAFPECTFVVQDMSKGYGTGIAVKCAEETVGEFSGDILIHSGDMPLITQETLMYLQNEHLTNKNDCTILSCEVDDVLTLGRIVRDKSGTFLEIIENKDCTDEQRKIKEYNTSVMLFNSKKLFEQLKNLKNNNKKGEYYLTDVPKLFLDNNYKVGVCKSINNYEIYGADSIEDLIRIENILKRNSTK